MKKIIAKNSAEQIICSQNQPNYAQLVDQFKRENVLAIVLMGSYARGDSGPYSDVDLVRIVSEDFNPDPDSDTHIINDFLVVVSNVFPNQIEEWFSNPVKATECIAGIRLAKPLWDTQGIFEKIKNRAISFCWDSDLQEKANQYASIELVGWIEEAHKGLEGLRRNDTGRLLNARFGLSWGLTNIIRVQKGILISGDNNFLSDIINSLEPDSRWSKVAYRAFGIDRESLTEQVKAGLKLYVLTVELIEDALIPKDKEMIMHTVHLIKGALLLQ